MDSRSRAVFGLLILAQAAHSVEEYAFRLFEVFAPARFVASLISSNAALGFAIGNIALVAFGAWCFVARVRPSHPAARWYAWFWTALELANGVNHVALSIQRGAYFPGVITAPLLIATASYLAARLFSLGGYHDDA